jgi:hypothetical protein
MTGLHDFLRKKLIAQTNCPCCGVVALGGDDNSRSFACSSEFIVGGVEILVSRACPASSYVAVAQLNKEATDEAAEAGAA